MLRLMRVSQHLTSRALWRQERQDRTQTWSRSAKKWKLRWPHSLLETRSVSRRSSTIEFHMCAKAPQSALRSDKRLFLALHPRCGSKHMCFVAAICLYDGLRCLCWHMWANVVRGLLYQLATFQATAMLCSIGSII